MLQSASQPPLTYLLRVWVAGVSPSGDPQLRFMVERVSGELKRQGFDSVDALVAYLRAEIAGGAADDVGRALRPDG